MAAFDEVLPTPVEGGWVTIDAFPGLPVMDPTPVEGGWVTIDAFPRFRRPRTSVGILVARAPSAG